MNLLKHVFLKTFQNKIKKNPTKQLITYLLSYIQRMEVQKIYWTKNVERKTTEWMQKKKKQKKEGAANKSAKFAIY